LPTPGDAPGYRLPGPLSHRGELPVAPGAPRIPRALRAFNGMPPAPVEDEPPPTPPSAASPAPGLRGRPAPREPLTIRDLLEESSQEEVDEGPLAGLRTALRRLRKGH
jgi:hypothetical protein